MTKWFVIEGGESILSASVIGVGVIKKIKVSSGKGRDLVEKTVFNFTIRLGTGGVIVKSQDYPDADTARSAQLSLMA